MSDGTLSREEQVVKAAADAVVADAVNTIRQHPQYVGIVNELVDKGLQALLAAL